MSNFRKGEWVLISDGNGGYLLRQLGTIHKEDAEVIHGYYSSLYSFSSLHKAPKSLINERVTTHDGAR
jgi:hypothetical protein